MAGLLDKDVVPKSRVEFLGGGLAILLDLHLDAVGPRIDAELTDP
jgi:hypothetical protein